MSFRSDASHSRCFHLHDIEFPEVANGPLIYETRVPAFAVWILRNFSRHISQSSGDIREEQYMVTLGMKHETRGSPHAEC